MLKSPKRTTRPRASFWIVAISSTRMQRFLTLYSVAEIRAGFSPPVGRMDRAAGGTRGLMGVMILRYCLQRPHSSPSHPHHDKHFARQAMERDGYSASHNGHFTVERERLWRGTMGPFREVVELLLLLPWACIGFVQPAYLHQASLVTDMMALCLQTATGQSVGIATIYPIELSRWALSAAKDIGWAGRVKQLTSTILSVVMSQA